MENACPKCLLDIPQTATVCGHCGYKLRASARIGPELWRIGIILLVIFMVWLLLTS